MSKREFSNRSTNSTSKSHGIDIAADTLRCIENESYNLAGGQTVSLQPFLRNSIESSTFYPANSRIRISSTPISTQSSDQHADISPVNSSTATPPQPTISSNTVEVRQCTTLEAAYDLAMKTENPQKSHIGVLNFASAKNPGGGFITGAKAQEESLARSSCLYPTLTKHSETFYAINAKDKSCLYTNGIIYSPDCPIFKNDAGDYLNTPYAVDFITCPAPNAGVFLERDPKGADKIQNALIQRTKRIIEVAKEHGANTLVLGAWGCGVFRNDPAQVATIFRQELKEFSGRVVFAVLDENTAKTFARVFNVDFVGKDDAWKKQQNKLNGYNQFNNRAGKKSN